MQVDVPDVALPHIPPEAGNMVTDFLDTIPKAKEKVKPIDTFLETMSKQKAAQCRHEEVERRKYAAKVKAFQGRLGKSASAPELAFTGVRTPPRPNPAVSLNVADEDRWLPPKIAAEDVKVGMELQGVRGRYGLNGVFINIGAPRDGFLHTSEWRDGFPEEQPFVLNERIPVRVLHIDDEGRIFLTCRTGPLERPPMFKIPAIQDSDIEAFDALSESDSIEAEVVRIALYGVFVKVQVPGSQMVQALLHKNEMTQELKETVSLGMKVQVRLLKKDDWKQKKVIGVACAE
ncbi:unnamed protein product [Symbiodinium necroappetens]|uniref:S1 motif domain-containing protein n=1 Tax=Symbiodinium necroappetens TaxID=1628268 RepID=A0A812VET2_9DINO|nr:unnamed protein product [Symbiodinium necroappetens]